MFRRRAHAFKFTLILSVSANKLRAMRKWLRPVILTVLVSFLLGIWFSLRKAENHILSRLKTLPKVVLLTDHPEWWRALADKARTQAILDLELITPPRAEWEAVIKDSAHGCHLVAIKSLFQKDLAVNQIISPFPDELATHWDQVHPDFRPKDSREKHFYLPVAWSVTRWRQSEDTPSANGRLQIKTSPDEALLAAYDLNLVGPAESDGGDEELDWSAIAKAAWNRLTATAFFDFTGVETTIPPFPVKGLQEFAKEDLQVPPPKDFPAAAELNLWTYGLSLCQSPVPPTVLARFFQWFLDPEQLALFLKSSQLNGAMASLEHGGIPEIQRPSGLRRFSLAKLRQRDLSWSIATAWHEIFSVDTKEK